jgi:HEAT repeat protein
LEAVVTEMSLAERIVNATARFTPEEASALRSDLERAQRAGITSVEQLVVAVGDTNQQISTRLIACSLVAQLNVGSASTALAHALEDGGDDGLVWEAAKALIRLRAENAAPNLVRVLRQGNSSQQSAAAYVLGWLGVSNTAPALQAAALNPNLAVEARGHAAEALGVMEAREAVPDLITLLSDASPEVRYWAAYALGQIGDPGSISSLERMASVDVAVLPHDRSLKQEALDALAAIRARDEDRT